MLDGTYLKLGGDYHRIESTLGYWVASSETTLEQVADGDLFGVWEDSEGKLWIDHTHYFTDLDSALEFARNHRQLAIWDNQNAAAIDTRETVTIRAGVDL
mgnify:FL=1